MGKLKSDSIMRKSLRWLLGLDQPVERLSAAEVEMARDRHFRWNFFVNSFDVIFFMTGLSLLSATTILPLFISKLTDSTIPLALMAMVAQSGFYLPQLFVANFIERLDRKKPMVVNLGFFTERLPAILLMLAPLLAFRSSQWALILFFFLYIWFQLGTGVSSTAWQELIARCFPVTWRGRFFGGNTFIGTALGVGAVSLAGTVLDQVAFPLNFAYIFAAAGLLIMLSWVFIAQTREPVEVTDMPHLSTREYLAQLPGVVRADHNFRNFLVARTVLAFAEMGTGFLTIAAIQQWDIADSMVATFTTASLIGQTVANLLMGVLADRYGHRMSLEFSSFTAFLAFGLAWLAPTPSWFVFVFFLFGFFTGARMVSGILLVLEFSVPEKRPTYVGLANTLVGVASVAAPLVGAMLVEVSYSWLFVASMLTCLVALLMLRFWVKEPRFA
ncbi:MAG: MFS transporter [Ardenticatenaceae bacterium]